MRSTLEATAMDSYLRPSLRELRIDKKTFIDRQL